MHIYTQILSKSIGCFAQGRSQDFTWGASEAERRRRKNRGDKGAERGADWKGGVPLPSD